MDDFKRKNIKDATAWDWNCPFVCKRQKGDSQRLRQLARTRLKRSLKKMYPTGTYLLVKKEQDLPPGKWKKVENNLYIKE